MDEVASGLPGSLSFGRFRIDPQQRALWVDGEPAKLGARAFDILLALAERRARVVGKHELMEIVWPKLVVEAFSQSRSWRFRSAWSTMPSRDCSLALPRSQRRAASASTSIASRSGPRCTVAGEGARLAFIGVS
jgi:hypothetical protein